MNQALNIEVARRIVHVLNRAHGEDPHAIAQLIDARVGCNRNLAEDPTIQVRQDEESGRFQVGVLGLLNGIAGKIETGDLSGYGYVAAIYQVVCPQNDRHGVADRVVGDACPVCESPLETGKLLGFDLMGCS